MIMDWKEPVWPKWMRRLLLLMALSASGCVVNPVPTPGTADESPTSLPIDGKANDSLSGGGAADGGISRAGADVAADGPGDVSPTDASVTTDAPAED